MILDGMHLLAELLGRTWTREILKGVNNDTFPLKNILLNLCDFN